MTDEGTHEHDVDVTEALRANLWQICQELADETAVPAEQLMAELDSELFERRGARAYVEHGLRATPTDEPIPVVEVSMQGDERAVEMTLGFDSTRQLPFELTVRPAHNEPDIRYGIGYMSPIAGETPIRYGSRK